MKARLLTIIRDEPYAAEHSVCRQRRLEGNTADVERVIGISANDALVEPMLIDDRDAKQIRSTYSHVGAMTYEFISME